MRNFSNEQQAFIEAKALMKATEENVSKSVKNRAKLEEIDPYSENDKEIERYVEIEMEVEDLFDYQSIRKLYREAFWKLLGSTIRKMKKWNPKKAKDLEVLLDPEHKTFVWMRHEKISSVLMSVDLEEVEHGQA
jgi:hypothetical protein